MQLRRITLRTLAWSAVSVLLAESAWAAPFWDWSMPPSLGRSYPGAPVAAAPVMVQPPATQIPITPAPTAQPPIIQMPAPSCGAVAPRPVAPTCGTPAPVAVPTCGSPRGVARPFLPNTTFYRQPMVGYAPQPAFIAPQPVSTFRPFGSYYRRGYRTRWYRVPVTQYRPVVAYQPTTGAQTVQMQPCGTYSWQAQRVPAGVYRPVYASGLAYQSPGMGQVNAVTSPQIVTTPQTVPTYVAPGAAPTFSAPTMPPPPTASGSGVPGTVAPPSFPQTPATPADQQPTLQPGEVQGISNRTTSPSRQPPIPRRATASPAAPAPTAAAPTPPPTTPGHSSDVVPIPDPEPRSNTNTNDDRIPQLLSPQNHTAQAREPVGAWQVSAIQWPAAAPPARDRVLPKAPQDAPQETNEGPALSSADGSAAPVKQTETWDDSGWTSTR